MGAGPISRLGETGPAPSSVRARIRRDLPPYVFARRPLRALWYLPLVVAIAGGTWAVLHYRPAWYIAAAASLVLGNLYAMVGLLSHEVLHGALVRSRILGDLLACFGLGPFLVSPTLWRKWHVEIHHANTNTAERDPDTFAVLASYQRDAHARFITRLAPGSGHPLSFVFFTYWFAFHGQLVLWRLSRDLPDFATLNRRRAIGETLAFAACWVILAFVAGPLGSLYVIVVPQAVSNAIVMSYIATNHLLRPRSESDDPLLTSMSVRKPEWIDRMHFRFSHHVEHHLFPRMSGKFAPSVRAWLEEEVPERYVAPPHWRALAMLYATPRVYLDEDTLCDPADIEGSRVTIADITRKLTTR